MPVLALIMATAKAAAPGAGTSDWVQQGADGKLIYKRTPTGDRIIDFSHAGYMGGGVPLPEVPVKVTLQPTEAADMTAEIQAAIAQVEAMPLEHGHRGAVLLGAGVFPCAGTVTISESGVVLRRSESGGKRATIRMSGPRHSALVVKARRASGSRPPESSSIETSITDAYVPSGATSFTVDNVTGLAAGDIIAIRRPVTAAWIRFMRMESLARDGKPQTWIREGSQLTAERRIAGITGNKLTVEVPLADSYDATYLNPPGTAIAKVDPSTRLRQVGIENLHIESPEQALNHTEALYSAIRLDGEDCWVKDVAIDETMNSVGVNGNRVTLQRVSVTRKARHEGSSKPAEFAPNGGQVLMDRCSVHADNVWFAGTGAGVSGPVVMLNCSFEGDGRVEGHQRWTTGLLVDNCRVPGGGIDFKNRGAMGSGHGWGLGWAVAWNCLAKDYVIQQPPGAMNWAIGCVGAQLRKARPFDSQPTLPEGTFDSHGTPVTPKSLYLTQLAERLGPPALKNLGYAIDAAGAFTELP